MKHVDDLLTDYALGALSSAERDEVEAHLADCARCRVEADELVEDLAGAAALAPPVQPSPALKQRVLASVDAANRFERFTDVVASLCDVATAQAAALLGAIDDASRWLFGPAEGVEVFHIDAGPARADAIVGFTRIAPGKSFPQHAHVGDEVVVILQGSYVDPDGTIHRTGDRVDMKAGTAHAFVARPGPPLVYLVVVDKGITFAGDDFVGPDDPRA
jgi:putative transcriptional regulator